MVPNYVLIIHGITDPSHGHLERFKSRVRRAFERAVRRSGEEGHRQEIREGIIFREAAWQRQGHEAGGELLNRMFGKVMATHKARRWMWMREMAAGYVLDLLNFVETSRTGDAITAHNRSRPDEWMNGLLEKLSELNHIRNPKDQGNLTIVSHGLASLVAAGALVELGSFDWIRSAKGLDLVNMFTMGSPLALLAMAPEKGRFIEPVDVRVDRAPKGCWVNMVGETDVVALPLRNVSERYRKALLSDLMLKVGGRKTSWNPASHMGYWYSDRVAKVIGYKLALDWLTLNRPRVETAGVWRMFSQAVGIDEATGL